MGLLPELEQAMKALQAQCSQHLPKHRASFRLHEAWHWLHQGQPLLHVRRAEKRHVSGSSLLANHKHHIASLRNFEGDQGQICYASRCALTGIMIARSVLHNVFQR